MLARNHTPGKKQSRMWVAALLGMMLSILALTPDAHAAGEFNTLHEFSGGAGGGLVYGGLILDQMGNFYGTTARGGTQLEGTVFKLTPNANGKWTESVLYNFCSRTNCADGADPQAGLIFDQAGNLYGTTVGGGTPQEGVAFELTSNASGEWTERVLHTFCSRSNCADGALPQAGLIFDNAGNLYGTTFDGGAHGGGTVFSLAPNSDGSWTESVLHSFCSPKGCGDGAHPQAGLIFDAMGNLYGTTADGGLGYGTVFKLTSKPDGSWKERVLYRFRGGEQGDGEHPLGGLISDVKGNLYGTTFGSDGVVYRLQNSHGSWEEKILLYFSGGTDGGFPAAALVFDSVGNLYGTTLHGGNLSLCEEGCGVIFKLAPSSNGGWNATVLHRFVDRPGAFPFAGLIVDVAGNLYGTSSGDQVTTFGSVFEVTP